MKSSGQVPKAGKCGAAAISADVDRLHHPPLLRVFGVRHGWSRTCSLQYIGSSSKWGFDLRASSFVGGDTTPKLIGETNHVTPFT